MHHATIRASNKEVIELPETPKKQPPLYTMLEVAKIVGCSKSTVYRVVKENHLKRKKKKGQASLYDETLIKLVRSKIETDSVSSEPLQRNALDTLQKQLESKDRQIDQLQEQLKMAQVNLNQAQKALSQSLDIQTKQADKIKLLEAPNEEGKQVKHWWQFWK